MNYSGATGNNDLIKKMNLKHVLSAILTHRPVSRARIAAITGLNKVTVSSCVDFFVDKGLVYDLGKTEASRGRPATLIELNLSAGICVGIEVDYKELTILVTDLSGRKLEHNTIALVRKEPEYFVELVSGLVSDVKARYAALRLGIVGVGIALPGYYNVQTGIIEYIANLKSWNQFPIMSELLKLDLAVPIFIHTTVNAGAMGEIHRRRSNLPGVMVYVGGLRGLGVAVCQGGKTFMGNSGFAGRLGHSTIKMDGKLCSCGNKGCWELYGSAGALYDRLYSEDTPKPVHFQEIIDRLRMADPEVVGAVKELGHYHAIGLANVINAYNPDVICIGGYLGMLGSTFLESVNETLRDILPEHFLRDLTIYCSEYGELGGSFGAISMVINHLSDIFIDEDQDKKTTLYSKVVDPV